MKTPSNIRIRLSDSGNEIRVDVQNRDGTIDTWYSDDEGSSCPEHYQDTNVEQAILLLASHMIPDPETIVKTEKKVVQANGWVDDGDYYSARFEPLPKGIKGCPTGRSQVSRDEAVRDLYLRANMESGTSYTVGDHAIQF